MMVAWDYDRSSTVWDRIDNDNLIDNDRYRGPFIDPVQVDEGSADRILPTVHKRSRFRPNDTGYYLGLATTWRQDETRW